MAVYPGSDVFPGVALFTEHTPVAVLRATVSTVAVPLTSGVAPAGRRVVIRNTNASPSDTLSLGGDSGVTAGTGFLLDGGAQIAASLSVGDEIWAVRGGSADVAVQVLRVDPR